MTKAVTTRGPVSLPSVEDLPVPSARLARAMREAIALNRDRYSTIRSLFRADGGVDWFYDAPPPSELIEEAKGLLPVLKAASAPASPEMRQSWFRPLAAAVANPPTREDFTARQAAFVIASDGLPLIAFSRATQRQAMRSHQFFASCAELAAILQREADEHQRRVDDVERIAHARPRGEYDAALARHRDCADRPGTYPYHGAA